MRRRAMAERVSEERLRELEFGQRRALRREEVDPQQWLDVISDLRLARARVAALEGEVRAFKECYEPWTLPGEVKCGDCGAEAGEVCKETCGRVP
jgi:hypothetical protein